MSPATVLLSSPSGARSELRRLVTEAGFAVADHLLGSPPAVDFGPVVVAVIEVGESRPTQPGEHRSPGAASADWTEVAAAQTRRWRAELGDHLLPVMWVASSDKAAVGLDAGADVVLSRPVPSVADPAPAVLASRASLAPAISAGREDELRSPDWAGYFVAQLRALARTHSTAARVAVRAGEARLLGDQLRKALAQLDREQEMARRVRATFLPRTFPVIGGARFNVCYRPRSRSGGDFHDVRRLDEHHVGFFVGDVIGTGAAAGGLLGVFVQQSVVMKEIGELSYRVVPPDEILTVVNRHLVALGADDLPLVAMLAGVLNAKTGALALARAGLPAAVHVPATDTPSVWTVPGPFLGTADTTYQALSGTLLPGDRLLVGTDGTRPDGDPGPAGADRLLEAAKKHCTLTGPEFADAVARELLQHVRHADDFTLLCVEMR